MTKSREACYIALIKNLIRKDNFSQLLQYKMTKQITKKEFDAELKKNPHNYRPQQEYSGKFSTIIEIMKNFSSFDFSVNDIAEMLGVNQIKFQEYLNKKMKKVYKE